MRTSAFCINSTCPQKKKTYKQPEWGQIFRRLKLPHVKKCISSRFQVNEKFAKSLVPENAWSPQCAVHVRFGDGIAFKNRPKKYSGDKRLCKSTSPSCYEKTLQSLIQKCAPVTEIYLATDLRAFHDYASASWLNITSTSHEEVHWNDIPRQNFNLFNPTVKSVLTDWIALYSAQRSYSLARSTFFESVAIMRDRNQPTRVATSYQRQRLNLQRDHYKRMI